MKLENSKVLVLVVRKFLFLIKYYLFRSVVIMIWFKYVMYGYLIIKESNSFVVIKFVLFNI